MPALRVSESEDGPAVRWLTQLLHQAIQWSTSDIHLEPSEMDTRVRLRIDGTLQELPALPGDLRPAQAANELFALAAEHAAHDDLNPAGRGGPDYIHAGII